MNAKRDSLLVVQSFGFNFYYQNLTLAFTDDINTLELSVDIEDLMKLVVRFLKLESSINSLPDEPKLL